ncbi:hypothetical protein EV385_3025 [Krasilnikovia cinnamomea]|uniref:Uncharacterized protein n=1 Tax=Krasilnikovia cinnamomea TaxID=349313 RepID=A0A4V2G751_9ACTN|nr:hypothetical protein [Krasilnikovia cinnamomea]RZU51216.1 hypothetical protein EV385_3025 [Krasilnikovia cinnamomea]
MVSYVFRSAPEPPASRQWLAHRFPHRTKLVTDLRQRIQRAPNPITASPPDPRHFGLAVERTLALDLCVTPPYPDLFARLPADARRILLTTAGYRPHPVEADQPWIRTCGGVLAGRLFTVGSLLTDLDHVLRQLQVASPDDAHRKLRAPLRHRETLAILAGATRAARPAFKEFWTSYLAGFRDALNSYGPVVAAPVLLDGLRVADLIAGTTVVELKTGHLDDTKQFHDLVDQVLTYALLAPPSGHPVTAVVIYLARYHVMARYPVDVLAADLAGAPVDLAEAGEHLGTLIRAEQAPVATA